MKCRTVVVGHCHEVWVILGLVMGPVSCSQRSTKNAATVDDSPSLPTDAITIAVREVGDHLVKDNPSHMEILLTLLHVQGSPAW